MKSCFGKVFNRFMTTTIKHQKCPSFNPSSSDIFKNKTIYYLISRALLFKLLGNQTLVNISVLILQRKYNAYNGSLKPLIKKTIFQIFCSGENVSDCLLFADKLKKEENITSIVDHSCEELEGEAGFESNMLQKVNLLMTIGSSKSCVKHVPLKCTSLIDSGLLERLTVMLNNQSKGNIQGDMKDFQSLLVKEDIIKFESGILRFQKICEVALENNVCILLDAEQSNRQPAVEIIAQILSEKYNVIDPVVFNTYQTYLKRTPEVLKRDMKRAKTGNYIFAAKIVRGAYISSEREAANIKQLNSIGIREDPVLPLRIDTDLAYNLAVESILESISPLNSDSGVTSNSSRPAVMIATHNRESVQLAVDIMLKLSIPNDHPNVQFAQIQGMSDHVTLALSLSGYNVSKLLLFGSFEELLPWLLRRLEENKDIFGAMQSERKIYHQEIFRRLKIF